MARRLLYFVNADWYFCSHRLPMARAARDAGFDVHVATHVDKHRRAIETEGFHLHPLSLRRGSLDPRNLVASVREVRAVYRRVVPDLIHHVGVQPSVTGSLASVGLGLRTLNAITGMGFVFTSNGPRARLLRAALGPTIATLFNLRGAATLVQNPDDRAALVRLGVAPASIATIPGSGVDTRHFTPSPPPEGTVRVGFVGRLLRDKGLSTLMEAFRRLARDAVSVELAVAGAIDPLNPASFGERDLAAWRAIPGVSLWGQVSDVRRIWSECHIAVLPSRREGLPLSLLEAAACGRPLVATDVPGCREVARPGENAILVPAEDASALADALARLAADPALRARFGQASRKLVEARFSTDAVGAAIVRLYDDLIRDDAIVPNTA